MQSLARWFLYGEVDWDALNERARTWGPIGAGVLFGLGWAAWADALVIEKIADPSGYPFSYNLPGIIATIALLLINLIPRRDLDEARDSGDEGAETRARLWLLFSFLVAFGAAAGSVVLLLNCSHAGAHVAAGVGSVVQCGFVLGSALLFWAFRSNADAAYGDYY